MQEWRDIYHINLLKNDTDPTFPLPDWLALKAARPARAFHQTLPAYAPTPLLNLGALAAEGSVRAVFIKDEAARFGLKAFKALGSSYAVAELICRRLGLSLESETYQSLLAHREAYAGLALCTATDGNHGRGVAWTARLFGCPAHVFMPAGAEPERVQAIREQGADVQVTALSYDETVALAAARAAEEGWLLVQDTALVGLEEAPRLIIQGYSTIAAELRDQLALAPTHIFLQAGVGSMAGGLLAFLHQLYPAARFVILEPTDVACCYKAALLGDDAASIPGVRRTIMAGLNCGTPCSLIMPLLRQRADFFAACPDFVAAHGMRRAVGFGFESGESGAIGLGLIDLLLREPRLSPLRAALGVDSGSVLLAINTEGAMAPSVWRDIISGGAYPLPED